MSTSTLRIALARITGDADPARARERAAVAVRDAAADGARLIVLPEASLAPFGSDLRRAAREEAQAFDETITHLAEELDAVVIAGSFTAADEGRVHNTLLARGRSVRAEYDKIHLYDAFGAHESATIAPGEELVLITVDGVRVGLATCYDIRFPEQFVALARAGAQVIALPMAWGDGPGKAEQLRVLQRARALDATAIILAADQVPPPGWQGSAARGVDGGAVISPLGEVLAAAGSGIREGESGQDAARPIVCTLDLESVERARRTLPVLSGRPELPGV